VMAALPAIRNSRRVESKLSIVKPDQIHCSTT
jgi:hypothetical protein